MRRDHLPRAQYGNRLTRFLNSAENRTAGIAPITQYDEGEQPRGSFLSLATILLLSEFDSAYHSVTASHELSGKEGNRSDVAQRCTIWPLRALETIIGIVNRGQWQTRSETVFGESGSCG